MGPISKEKLLQMLETPEKLSSFINLHHVAPLLQVCDEDLRSSLESCLQELCSVLRTETAGDLLLSAVSRQSKRYTDSQLSESLICAYVKEIVNASFGDYKTALSWGVRANKLEEELSRSQPIWPNWPKRATGKTLQSNEYNRTNKGGLLQTHEKREKLASYIMQEYVAPLLRVQNPEAQTTSSGGTPDEKEFATIIKNVLELKLLKFGASLWAEDSAKTLLAALTRFGAGIEPKLLAAYITEFSAAAFGDYKLAGIAKNYADKQFQSQPFTASTASRTQPTDVAVNTLTQQVLSYVAPPKA